MSGDDIEVVVVAETQMVVAEIQRELRKMLDACPTLDMYGADGRVRNHMAPRVACGWCRADRFAHGAARRGGESTWGRLTMSEENR